MKDPVEVQLPSGYRFLIVPRMNKSRDRVPSDPFDGFFLDLRYGPAIERDKRIVHNVRCWLSSRRQLRNRLTHGLAEVIKFLAIHSPVKSSAYVRAG